MGRGRHSLDARRNSLLIVAGPGWGKTAALDVLGRTGGSIYVRAEQLRDATPDRLRVDAVGSPVVHLCVDDVHELGPGGQRRLAALLRALPPDVDVSLASARPVDPDVRAALGGLARERGPAELALDLAAVGSALCRDGRPEDPELTLTVHELTAGWPALVRAVAEGLAALAPPPSGDPWKHVTELTRALAEPQAPFAAWVRDVALADLPEPASRVLDTAVDLDPGFADLYAELLDPAAAEPGVAWLERTGILARHPRCRCGCGRAPLQTVPLVAAVLGASARRRGDPQLLSRAARWYLDAGHPLAAATTLRRAGDAAASAGLVERFGEQMLAGGGAVEVARLAASVPGHRRSRRLTLVLGDALRMSGEPVAARRALAPLLDAPAPSPDAWGLAWRSASLHYLCGDYASALAEVEGALGLQHPERPTTGDLVALQAIRAHTLEMTGRGPEAAAAAEQALRSAQDVDDDRLLATAALAVAATSAGAPRDDALAQALAAAERAGDVVQQARALLLQSHALLEEALYSQAHEMAARAVRAAERGSPPGLLSVALYNDGEALTRLGRLSEARTCFTRSVQLCRRAGLQRAAAGLRGLGDVHRRAGLRDTALRAYADAIALSRSAGEMQVLVPALAAWAHTLAEGPSTSLEPARDAAAEAVRCATPALLPLALMARGWVHLGSGDAEAARRDADAATRAAREGPGAGSLPEALELLAAASDSVATAREALREALALWDAGGAAACADDVRVRLARLPGAGGPERAAGRAAQRRLASLGLTGTGVSAQQVRVRVLGGFDVEVRGEPVPLAAWRSRQARTLLKVLASRGGRPVPRSELCELLWPDDDPRRTGHRLSVLLSAVRGVLDPDKARPPDHHLRADLHAVSLDLEHVAVDLEELLQDATHGCALLRDGDREGGRELLGAVDAAYRGDAFDEDPYEEWAQAPREHARAVWLRCVRHLIDLSGADGDDPLSAELLARALSADAYDVASHRALVDLLVRSGRHGEARRAYERWDRAMTTIGAPSPAAVSRWRARGAGAY